MAEHKHELLVSDGAAEKDVQCFRPIDVLVQQEAQSAPGFKRVEYRNLCYYCKFLEYSFGNGFRCGKHGVIFGRKESLPAEFCCDDFVVG